MVKWTYEACFEEAKKYSSVKSFRKESHAAYTASIKYKWIEKFDWLKRTKQNNGYWNKERCYEEAKKYSSRSDFVKGSPGAYQKALKEGWRNDYTWLPNAKRWTYEEVYNIAKQYEYKVDFYKNNCGAYDKALREGWLNDFDWFLDGIKRTGENHRKWNYNTCKEESKKYKSRGEFGTKSQRAYLVSLQNGWLDEFFSKSK